MPEEQPANPWTEWGRHVLAELVRLNVSYEELDKKLDFRLRALNEKLDLRLRHVELQQERIKERLTIYAAIQAIFTAIAATIAGFIGARQ